VHCNCAARRSALEALSCAVLSSTCSSSVWLLLQVLPACLTLPPLTNHGASNRVGSGRVGSGRVGSVRLLSLLSLLPPAAGARGGREGSSGSPLFGGRCILTCSLALCVNFLQAEATTAVAENVTTLGPRVTEGEQVFGVAHIFASFNDTFVVSITVPSHFAQAL
jgi:hypothetical protein